MTLSSGCVPGLSIRQVDHNPLLISSGGAAGAGRWGRWELFAQALSEW